MVKAQHLSALSKSLFHSKVSHQFGGHLHTFSGASCWVVLGQKKGMKQAKCLFRGNVYILQREFTFREIQKDGNSWLHVQPSLVLLTKTMNTSKNGTNWNKKPKKVMLAVLSLACCHNHSNNANVLFIFSRFYSSSNVSLFCVVTIHFPLKQTSAARWAQRWD